MKVLGCGSIPVATIKMKIAEMQKDGKGFQVYDVRENSKKPFWVFMPQSVVKKLHVGDTIVVTCTPNETLEFATETLIVTKFTGPNSAEEIFNRDIYNGALNVDIYQ